MLAPICIFSPGSNTADDASALENLLTDDILNKKVVVISVAGRFRQGKSFLMNLIIRYLRAKGATDWFDNSQGKRDQDELKGFDWRHTRSAVTVGVLIWPEIFKIKNVSGEELVVILVDTQGVFDTNSTIKDSTKIFSLSVLLSSIQIFNIKQNIQGDDLSQLELFTEFGRLVCSGSSDGDLQNTRKPFQDLIFLVRDWVYPKESPYGWKGGQRILDKELQQNDVRGELNSMRASIKNCFESFKCFLMPHPGEKVDTSDEFRGQVSDMKPDFVKHVKRFIEDIFRSSSLKPKRVHGNDLTVRDFIVFVELYVREMHSEELPTSRTLYDATVNATNFAVVNNCSELYQARMAALITRHPQKIRFDVLHDFVFREVLAIFDLSTKMGDQAVISAAADELEGRIVRAKDRFEGAHSAAYERMQLGAESEKLQEEKEDLKIKISQLGDKRVLLQRCLENAANEKARMRSWREKVRCKIF